MSQAQKRRQRLAVLGISTAAAGALALGGAIPAQGAQGAVINAGVPQALDGQYIVALDGVTSLSSSAEAAVAAEANALIERYGGQLDHVYSAVLRGYAVDDLSESQARKLAADPAVRYVQQSLPVRAVGEQPNPPSYGLDRIDGALDEVYQYPNAGSGVHIYVLDTGLNLDHQEFEGRAESGYDAVDEDNNVNDCQNSGSGHGSHTAGTTASEAYGVAKDATVVGVRVLDCGGTAPDQDTIEGLDWVTQNAQKPAVGNMSLTSGGANAQPQAMREATQRAIESGVQFAIAAGNSGADACNVAPGNTAAAITVGATTRNDGRASYSNYGSCLDVFAPGSNIVSASNTSDTGSKSMSGTSMASPHVAGAAALYLSSHPDASAKEVRDAIVAAAQEGVVGDPGSGSPNLLLNVTDLGTPADPGQPVAEFTADCSTSAASCTFDGSGSSDEDGSIASYAWDFGDGQTGTGVTPSHTYAEAGVYNVTLTVTDNDGKTAGTSKEVTAGTPAIGDKPQAEFTAQCGFNTGCTFDASSSTDDRGITGYAWDFGDGQTGTGPTAQHSYTGAGNYTVTLTVTDQGEQTDTAQRQLQCFDFGNSAFCFPG